MTQAEPIDVTTVRPSAAEIDAMRHVEPFSALSRAGCAALCREASVRSVSSRSVLLVAGRRPEHLDVVLEGCVELRACADGREATLGIVRRAECFDLPAVVRDLPCLASARSCAPTRLLSIPAAAVREALGRDPAFARALVRELADDVRLELRANGELKLCSSVERLAAHLLDYEREQGGHGTLVLPCDKRTLASLLAMTPENLSRAFATLGAAGVVVDGPSIGLRDRTALVAVARRRSVGRVDRVGHALS